MGFRKRSGSILSRTIHKDLTIQSLVRGADDPELDQKMSEYRERQRLDSLLVHQKAFLESKDIRHVGLVAGFGAGKSYSLTVKILQLCYDNPGFTGIAMEPTYGLLNDILIPQMQDIWDEWGVDYTLHKAAAEVMSAALTVRPQRCCYGASRISPKSAALTRHGLVSMKSTRSNPPCHHGVSVCCKAGSEPARVPRSPFAPHQGFRVPP